MNVALPNSSKTFLAGFCLLLSSSGQSETIAEARQRFATERAPLPNHGLYEDFRAVIVPPNATSNDASLEKILATARKANIRVVLTAERDGLQSDLRDGLRDGLRESVLVVPCARELDGKFSIPDLSDKTQEVLQRGVNRHFDQSSPGNFVTHILAREFTGPLIRESLSGGHFYVADDWLCDPTGFMFGAMNNQGVFTMGNEVATINRTRVMAVAPVPAKLRLFRETQLVQETFGTNIIYEAKDNGSYRLEAWLTAAGTDRPWIFSSPVFLRAPNLSDLAKLAPLMNAPPGATVAKDIPYHDAPEADPVKHKLDIYSRPGLTNAPVLFFVHGGAWKTGDRSYYGPLGSRYAREGCVTVLPSYRLAPKFPHPAQVEDVAAAFAWTVRHIAARGGDTNRIVVAGHSAGAHLVSLLALDEKYLAAHQLSPKGIRGVMGFSGAYNLEAPDVMDSVFGKNLEARRAASPLFHVHSGVPPFLLTYCEWNYFSLPAQAKEFHNALQKAGVSSELVFIPRQDHISEMLNVANKDDPTVAAALKFMKKF